MTGIRGSFSNPAKAAASELIRRLEEYDERHKLGGEALRLLVDTTRVITGLFKHIDTLNAEICDLNYKLYRATGRK